MRALPVLILAGLVLLGLGNVAVARPGGTQARLQRLEDESEIRRLLTDYGRYLDARDWRAYSQLFAEKGQWVGGFGVATGPDEIYQTMIKNIGTKTGPNYHLLSNFEIDIDGDTATAWSRWSFIGATKDNKPVLLYGGHYNDKLIRERGRWKFLRREAPADVPAELPVGEAAASK